MYDALKNSQDFVEGAYHIECVPAILHLVASADRINTNMQIRYLDHPLTSYISRRPWLSDLVRGKSFSQLDYQGQRLFNNYLDDDFRRIPGGMHQNTRAEDINDLRTTEGRNRRRKRQRRRLIILTDLK